MSSRDTATRYPIEVARFGTHPVRVIVAITEGYAHLRFELFPGEPESWHSPSLTETFFADSFRDALDAASKYAIHLNEAAIGDLFLAAAASAGAIRHTDDIPY